MSVSGTVVFKRRVLSIADVDRVTEGRRTLQKIIRQWNRKEKADNAAVYFAICLQVALEEEWLSFFFLFGGDQIYTCSYINIMYGLDSARRRGRNSMFESVLHFCRIMRQDQSKVRQKCCSRFRHRISVEINSVNLKKPTARMNWPTVKYYKGSRKMLLPYSFNLSLNCLLPST